MIKLTTTAHYESHSRADVTWLSLREKTFIIYMIVMDSHTVTAHTIYSESLSRTSDFYRCITENTPGDEIANVNFLYDDIVHAIQNTIRLVHS